MRSVSLFLVLLQVEKLKLIISNLNLYLGNPALVLKVTFSLTANVISSPQLPVLGTQRNRILEPGFSSQLHSRILAVPPTHYPKGSRLKGDFKKHPSSTPKMLLSTSETPYQCFSGTQLKRRLKTP